MTYVAQLKGGCAPGVCVLTAKAKERLGSDSSSILAAGRLSESLIATRFRRFDALHAVSGFKEGNEVQMSRLFVIDCNLRICIFALDTEVSCRGGSVAIIFV